MRWLWVLAVLVACSSGSHLAPPDVLPDAGEECATLWFPDSDGDGFGDADAVVSCTPMPGHSLLGTDCDDTDPAINPGNPEVCDGLDNDCKNGVDDGMYCGVCRCALANVNVVACASDATSCTIGRCDEGFLDCDEDDATGCETHRESVESCGYCGNVCDARAACVVSGGLPHCECEAGLEGEGDSCGDCPAGYYGTAGVCGPVLTALTLSTGTLTPALSDSVTEYTARVSLATETISLTPTAAAGATIAINDQVVASNTPWQSPTLDLGDNLITIVVTQPDQPSRTYSLTVHRGADQTAYLKPDAPTSYGAGTAVAISGDTLVIGSYPSPFVFVRSGSSWIQQASLPTILAGDFSTQNVAISGDTIVIGVYGDRSLSTGVNGDETQTATYAVGAAHVFVRSGGVWSRQAYLKASNSGEHDYFGYAVAVSGDTVVIGAFGESSNAIGVDGDQSNNGSLSSGAAYVFVRHGSTWSQQAYLKASNTDAVDQFGLKVAISGDTLAVAAANETSNATGINGDESDNSAQYAGAVYVFTRSGQAWLQQAYIKASNTEAGDRFGTAIALDGDTLVVGAPSESSHAMGINGDQQDNWAQGSGAAYVFQRNASAWSQLAYLKADNAARYDGFGSSVAISGNYVLVGAPYQGGGALDPYTGTRMGDVFGAAYILSLASDCFRAALSRCGRHVRNVGLVDHWRFRPACFRFSRHLIGDTTFVAIDLQHGAPRIPVRFRGLLSPTLATFRAAGRDQRA